MNIISWFNLIMYEINIIKNVLLIEILIVGISENLSNEPVYQSYLGQYANVLQADTTGTRAFSQSYARVTDSTNHSPSLSPRTTKVELNFRLLGEGSEHQVVERASPRIRSHRRQRRRPRIGARASKCVRRPRGRRGPRAA